MKRREPEYDLQRAVVVWLRLQYPKVLFWHVPNANNGPVQWRKKLADLGVRPGVPDLHLLLPDGRYAMIELKARRGKLSEAQLDFIIEADKRGVLTAICRSLDDVRGTMASWMSRHA